MHESAGQKRVRAGRLLAALRRARPDPRVELEHANPFQLLIATILSAQCTDARVNQVTRTLFRDWPDAGAFARAPLARLQQAIRPAGFYRMKARAIQGCCRAILERHGGEVPRTMEELTRLPGVGRKTANVILGAGFGIPAGIVVDTHVARVAGRLRLTRQRDPVRIERDLTALLPPPDWIFFSIGMVLHGRYVCQARRPRCSACPLSPDCPSRHLESRGAGRAGVTAAARPRPRPSRGRASTRPSRPRASHAA